MTTEEHELVRDIGDVNLVDFEDIVDKWESGLRGVNGVQTDD